MLNPVSLLSVYGLRPTRMHLSSGGKGGAGEGSGGQGYGGARSTVNFSWTADVARGLNVGRLPPLLPHARMKLFVPFSLPAITKSDYKDD